MELREPWRSPPLTVDPSNLDAAVASVVVRRYFPLATELCPAGGIDLKIKRLKDFHPDALIRNHDPLTTLKDVAPPPRQPAARKKKEPASGLDKIFDMVALPDESTPSSSESDRPASSGGLQQVLAQIYSDPNFTAAETAWQGVKRLIQQQDSRNDPQVRLDIVPVSFDTLAETLAGLTLSQANDPPALVLIDLPFENTPLHISLLEKAARFAESLMAPTLIWISPRFLNLASWGDLGRLPFIPHHLEGSGFAKWRQLQSQPEANWLAATCNRFLLRHPYGKENRPRSVDFEEPVLPWTGPVWAVAELIVKSLAETGWPTRFTDWRSFQLEDLALHMDDGSAIPTETIFSEDRIDQFRRAGIMPLAAIPNKDIAFTPVETALGGASFTYQLFASRVTQLLLWCQDHAPTGLDGGGLESYLRRTFAKYWAKSGHPEPDDLSIAAGAPNAENRIPLRLELRPSRRILPSGDGLTLEILW